MLVEYPHDQRDFHAHYRANDQHQTIQNDAKRRSGKTKQHKQSQCGNATNDADQNFDFDEAHQRVFVFDVAGEVGAYAHGKQIQADDGRELQN